MSHLRPTSPRYSHEGVPRPPDRYIASPPGQVYALLAPTRRIVGGPAHQGSPAMSEPPMPSDVPSAAARERLTAAVAGAKAARASTPELRAAVCECVLELKGLG